MHVLANDQHRLLPRQTYRLVEKAAKCLSPLLHTDLAERRDSARRSESKAARRMSGVALSDLVRSKRKHCPKLVELFARSSP
jgi:hypothetical protein